MRTHHAWVPARRLHRRVWVPVRPRLLHVHTPRHVALKSSVVLKVLTVVHPAQKVGQATRNSQREATWGLGQTFPAVWVPPWQQTRWQPYSPQDGREGNRQIRLQRLLCL